MLHQCHAALLCIVIALGNRLVTLSLGSSELNGGMFGTPVPCKAVHADLPVSLQCLPGEPGRCVLSDARAESVSTYKRNALREIRTRVLDDVKCEGIINNYLPSYRGIRDRSVAHSAGYNPYNMKAFHIGRRGKGWGVPAL